jgi:hypothetical protein
VSGWLPDGVGKLAGTLMGVAVAQRANAERFARGRVYNRQGAVTDIQIETGWLHGVVQGSRPQPYEVDVEVTPLAASRAAKVAAFARQSPQRYTGLVPEPGELRFSCSCPDWDDPCKHAVAVMVRFGEMVTRDPRVLERWRLDAPADGEPTAQSGVGRRGLEMAPSGDGRAIAEPASRAFEATFVNAPAVVPEPPEMTPLAPPGRRWDEPWTDMLGEALEAIRDVGR